MIDFSLLESIIRLEFADIVLDVILIDNKLRIILIDLSYVDFWWSEVKSGRFAHHWQRGHIDGKIYRHDNAPHEKWKSISTFPQHFHCKDENSVKESYLSQSPEEAVRKFLSFCRKILKGMG